MFNAVMFLRFFSVVPAVDGADEIQFCYRRAFYPAFCKSPCSSAYLFTLSAVRGAVSWESLKGLRNLKSATLYLLQIGKAVTMSLVPSALQHLANGACVYP